MNAYQSDMAKKRVELLDRTLWSVRFSRVGYVLAVTGIIYVWVLCIAAPSIWSVVIALGVTGVSALFIVVARASLSVNKAALKKLKAKAKTR